MDESLRYSLYALGYLSSVAFTARFLLQWIKSEKAGKSVVPRAFWQISILGNLLLCLHTWIQLQFNVCVVSACNLVIAWRNLNLMEKPSKQWSFQLTVGIMLVALLFVYDLFKYTAPDGTWFRVPNSFWQHPVEMSPFWHVLGTLGIILFSSRFWIQWINAERKRESILNPMFWWLSLIGGVLSILYFLKMGDMVNLIGPAFGTIPYARNLMLIYRNTGKVQHD